jgi:palmitoyl-protein thioesterase
MKFLSLLPFLALCASASPLHAPFRRAFHPVVLWHGLGDSAYSEGMLSLAASLRDAFPGIFVHLVHLADDLAADQRAGFFGDTTQQVNAACEQLKQVKELQGGFDAVGFSQGGQLLRAVVQRCEGVQVRNLVTFGSQVSRFSRASESHACKDGEQPQQWEQESEGHEKPTAVGIHAETGVCACLP